MIYILFTGVVPGGSSVRGHVPPPNFKKYNNYTYIIQTSFLTIRNPQNHSICASFPIKYFWISLNLSITTICIAIFNIYHILIPYVIPHIITLKIQYFLTPKSYYLLEQYSVFRLKSYFF